MAAQQDKRRCARAPMEAQVEFRRKRETRYAIQMHDLSPHGCRLATPERLAGEEMIWVTLPGLESQQATVRWTRAWFAGVEFHRPMHVAVFDMMADRLQQQG